VERLQGIVSAIRSRRRLLPVAVFALSALVYGLRGPEGALNRDDAVYVYLGQQIVEGVPPYLSAFDGKTPLAAFFCALGVLLARLVGADDLLGVRLLFLALSCGAVASLFVLARSLLRSDRTALLAASVFLAFGGFGTHAFSGPRAKTPMVLFEILCLWLAAERRWFGAALCASLAFSVWQPMGAYLLAVLALAWLQGRDAAARRRNLLAALAGGSLPLLALLLYFATAGGLTEMIEDAFLFHLGFLERADRSVRERLLWPAVVVALGYATMRIPIAIGFLVTLGLYPWRLRGAGWSVKRLLREDRFAALLLTFPAPLVWSLFDFQSYPDFYVFLPYAALGFALGARGAIDALARRLTGWRGLAPAIYAFLCCLFLFVAARDYLARETGLPQQKLWTSRIEELAGGPDHIASIGRPELLVLSRATNPTPYIFFCCGILRWIDSRTEGGLEAWLESIRSTAPRVIAADHHRKQLPGAAPYVEKLHRWLDENYERRRVGRWMVWVDPRDPSRRP